MYHPKSYLDEVQAVQKDAPAVDCWGEAGGVVLWHHRQGHMAGHNCVKESLRVAILFDFSSSVLSATRADPPQGNMWRDWAGEMQQAGLYDYSPALAAE